MRHLINKKKFNRNFKHRKHMMNNLIYSLIKHEKIITTTIKAKYLRQFIEPIITKSKQYTLANKRHIFKKIQNKNLIFKLFQYFGPKYLNRNGGYTQIIKHSYRKGDNSQMSLIKFI